MKLKEFFKKIRADQPPNQEFHDKLKSSLVAYMKQNPPVPKATLVTAERIPASWRKGLAISFATFVVLGTSATLTVFAAQKALPGDALYKVKLAVDQWSVTIADSPAARIKVADRRLEEVKQVLGNQQDQNVRSQTDVQSALRQYQSNLQVAVTDMQATGSTPSSTVQNIIRTTTDNEKDLEQMIAAKSSNEVVARDLQDSLQSSVQTVEAAHTALKDLGSESDNESSSSISHPSTTRWIPRVVSIPSSTFPKNATDPAKENSTTRNNSQGENFQSNDGAIERKTEDAGRHQTSTIEQIQPSIGAPSEESQNWHSGTNASGSQSITPASTNTSSAPQIEHDETDGFSHQTSTQMRAATTTLDMPGNQTTERIPTSTSSGSQIQYEGTGGTVSPTSSQKQVTTSTIHETQDVHKENDWTEHTASGTIRNQTQETDR